MGKSYPVSIQSLSMAADQFSKMQVKWESASQYGSNLAKSCVVAFFFFNFKYLISELQG